MSVSHDLIGQIATPPSTPAGRRAQAARLLPAITEQARIALAEARIEDDVFFVVSKASRGIIGFGTLTDPDDEKWNVISQIVCRVVREVLGVEKVRTRELPCAVAHAAAPPA